MCLLRPLVRCPRQVPPVSSSGVLRLALETALGAVAECERELVVRRVPSEGPAGQNAEALRNSRNRGALFRDRDFLQERRRAVDLLERFEHDPDIDRHGARCGCPLG